MDDRCGNDNRPLYSPAVANVFEHLLSDQEEGDLSVHLPNHIADGAPLRKKVPSAIGSYDLRLQEHEGLVDCQKTVVSH